MQSRKRKQTLNFNTSILNTNKGWFWITPVVRVLLIIAYALILSGALLIVIAVVFDLPLIALAGVFVIVSGGFLLTYEMVKELAR